MAQINVIGKNGGRTIDLDLPISTDHKRCVGIGAAAGADHPRNLFDDVHVFLAHRLASTLMVPTGRSIAAAVGLKTVTVAMPALEISLECISPA